MWQILTRWTASALLFAAFAPRAAAQASPESWTDQVRLNGFVSFGYTFNLNRPSSGLNSLRLFDEKENTFNVDVAELVLQKAISKPGEAGFRLDITAGGAIPEKAQALGLHLGNAVDLQQAYVGYSAPVGTGLRLDFGKFVTHMGSELIEGYDGYNDSYSRSFLFNYAIPFTHTGVRATYSLSPAVSVTALVVNGWDNVEDNNRSKSVGAQLALTPSPRLTVVANYIGGAEQTGDASALRQVIDAVAVWRVTETLTAGVNYDYGAEERASAVTAGGDARWTGAAGYLKWDLTRRISVGVRGERFDDPDGARLARPESTVLHELTITPAYKLTDNFLIRAEARFDRANRDVFVKYSQVPSDRQTTLGANAVFVF